jgi:hypothetical protein
MSTVAGPEASHDNADQLSALIEASNVRLHDFVAAAVQGLVRGLGAGGEVELNPQPEPPGIPSSVGTVVHQWTIGLTYTRYVVPDSPVKKTTQG